MVFLGTDQFPGSFIHDSLEMDICFDEYSYHDSLIESLKGNWQLTAFFFLKTMTVLRNQ